MMKIRSIVISGDFMVSGLLFLFLLIALPRYVPHEFSKDLYGVGISVLSIVFSVYFAALAIIISGSDDDFVRFLEEVGDYSLLVSRFKWTLGSLVLGLIYSLAAYSITAADKVLWGGGEQTKYFLCLFSGLTVYSLLATAQSIMDAIRYSEHRIEYIKISEQQTKKSRPIPPNSKRDQ